MLHLGRMLRFVEVDQVYDNKIRDEFGDDATQDAKGSNEAAAQATGCGASLPAVRSRFEAVKSQRALLCPSDRF
jgi:hypothetical protein